MKFNFHTLYNISFLSGVLCILFYYFYDISYMKYIFGVIGNIIFIYEVRDRKINRGLFILYILLLILIIATLTKSLIFSTTEGIGNIPMLTAHIGYSISIYKNRISLYVPLILFIITSFYIFYNLFIGLDPNEIFYTRSRNHISILLIYLVTLLYIFLVKNEFKLWLWPSIITFVLSFLAIGRAGIISALILVVCLFLFKLVFKLNNVRKTLTVILLSCATIVVIYVNIDDLLLFAYNDLRIAEMKYSEDIRLLITQNYISSVDNLEKLLFGFPYEQQTAFYGNHTLHNSYLKAHFRYGVYSILILFLIILALVKGIKELNIYVIFLIVICIRGITDTILIGESFDFIFYALLAIILSNETDSLRGSLKYLSKRKNAMQLIKDG